MIGTFSYRLPLIDVTVLRPQHQRTREPGAKYGLETCDTYLILLIQCHASLYTQDSLCSFCFDCVVVFEGPFAPIIQMTRRQVLAMCTRLA